MRLVSCLATVLLIAAAAPAACAEPGAIAIAIHGGAGAVADMTPEKEAAYRAGLAQALDAGYAVLARGDSSLDAVTVAVKLLEDNPLFNAGKGAVLAHDGAAELDAAIMDGRDLRAGAVAGVRHVRNPIELARLVMEKSTQVLLIGDGAEEFALEQGVTLVPNEYFRTEARRRQLERALNTAGAPARDEFAAFGTVGAVARDARGDLAAATSTGGLTNKRHGRVGDSPIIGAGTYAGNASCAVSATGEGEFFIRTVVARDICARVEYQRVPIARAVHDVVQDELRKLGAEGGVIAIDPAGNVAMDFNSDTMFRGMRNAHGLRTIAVGRNP
ncbi:MAG: isoaspartyl peptidase/L-asparaginase [Steroidobacteraceae bacterium]